MRARALIVSNSPERKISALISFCLRISCSASSAAVAAAEHSVFLALGSNLGDRAGHIEAALRRVHAAGGDVYDTSFLYETRPAYVSAQPAFLNAACRVRTRLPPAQLLACVKQIERDLGREPTVRNGPRVIDIDILSMCVVFDFYVECALY